MLLRRKISIVDMEKKRVTTTVVNQKTKSHASKSSFFF